ncbi:MAG TPA: LLM class flavin-dependent oxidoreductase [Gaiellaceae bacterium]|jgi:alkanesulfonate monooxygenase SsuD/methylene tetrahydromethanopterin reductase-like flavin-dependent oxidoreductase (luciferase family)|nr:LLM class flavin-dependent oxidoreductase [Gaiellaceae bacterium]
MRFGVVQEAYFPPGTTLQQRYLDMVDEAVAAEEAGFDFYCTSEQHFGFSETFLTERADKYHAQKSGALSSPESFLPFVAARTERIKLRPTSVVLLTFNNPLRVAEWIATLDNLTNGRAELGTARSNNLSTIRAFGVDPKDTKDIWRESLEVIVKAFTEDPFTYEGEWWNFPEPRALTPKSIQKPHPPIHVSCSSVASHRGAAELGLGAMTGGSIVGWQYVEEAAAAYTEAIADAQPLPGSPVQNSLGFFATRVNCGETPEEARAPIEQTALAFIDINIGPGGRYEQLAPTSPDYAYLGNIQEMQAHQHDLDYIMEKTPYVLFGTPDFLIEKFKRLEAMGYTEMLLGIEGMSHEANLRAIEMLGKHVLPAFDREPATVA